MIGGALTLYAWRAPKLRSQAGFELGAARVVSCFSTTSCWLLRRRRCFAGTMAPLISDSLGLGTLSVGAPYFNPTFMLSMLPLAALVAIGISANWKRGRLGEKKRMLFTTLAIAAVIACIIVFAIYANGKILTPVAATLGIWIILTSLVDPIDRLRRKLTLSRSMIGMTVAHIGLGLFVLSLTTVESFTVEHDVSLARGASTTVGAYQFRFDGVKAHPRPELRRCRRYGRRYTKWRAPDDSLPREASILRTTHHDDRSGYRDALRKQSPGCPG